MIFSCVIEEDIAPYQVLKKGWVRGDVYCASSGVEFSGGFVGLV